MKAEEARAIAVKHLDVQKYVVGQIRDDVRKEAENGKFTALVRILYPDNIDYTKYEEFREKAMKALTTLGYAIVPPPLAFCAGIDVTISWDKK